MKPEYHKRITIQALEKRISPAGLETVVAANLGQDILRYQFGHEHFHYDNNSFSLADSYIAEQRHIIMDALARIEALTAWQAFGRMAHTVQDFYAHTNYVSLWRERHPQAADQIPPLFDDALNDPRLHSGRLYYPLEILAFIPVLRPVVLPFLPRDSHAWMNKDDPSYSDFDLAYTAAVKRTELEFQNVIQSLTHPQTALFMGSANR